MKRIVGTVLTVEEFYSSQEAFIHINVKGDDKKAYRLEQNRKYIIPDFQREIRWKKENVIELITDVEKGPKFLGTIILTHTEKGYEIIDGQQRSTIINMLIQCIRDKYPKKFPLIDVCELVNESFKKYVMLQNKSFNMDSMCGLERDQILESDKLNQYKSYLAIWNTIKDSEVLATKRRAADLWDNLKQCELNIIINTNSHNASLQYFLDVNLKGVQLDTEDIFKSYLYDNDNSEKIRSLWPRFKYLSQELVEHKVDYPLLKLLEQALYCMFYRNGKNREISFNEKFRLTKEVVYQNERHYVREHIIKVIYDMEFMQDLMTRLNAYITFVIKIVGAEIPDAEIKEMFTFGGKQVDNTQLKVIHNFIKKILLDSRVVPKILIMKYYFEVLYEKNDEQSKSYKNIYGIYTLSVLFVFFSTRKNSEKIYSIVKERDWYLRCIELIKLYFNSSYKSENRMTVHFKYAEKDDEENYQFRCKSLATIYNFFVIEEKTVVVKNMDELQEYLSSPEFTTEHFILNKSKKCKLSVKDGTVDYSYPKQVKRYIDSIFNFIFIGRKMNGGVLEDSDLNKKLYLLKEAINNQQIKCKYSKMIVSKIEENFNFPDTSDMHESEAIKEVNYYFYEKFKEDYSNYVTAVINELYNKFQE